MTDPLKEAGGASLRLRLLGVFASGLVALAHHVSGGPFSGIGYAIGQILAVFFTIVGLCAGLGGLLAMAGRRAGRG